MKPTPISKISLDGRVFFIKRDDQIDRFLAGNKYRKLYKLLQTPKEHFDTIISYGGTQSNAMLAIAALCQQKGWCFIYYTKPLSTMQKQQNFGNYYEALQLGMQHREVPHALYKDLIASLHVTLDTRTFLIDQGGASILAEDGLKVLADEIAVQREFLQANNITALATPSGTGTTALFLARTLPDMTVYTTPSVGDVNYLKQQILALCPKLPDNLVILGPRKKYHFAKPYKEFYAIYKKLQMQGIEFDLLYAPLLFQTLLEQTNEYILYIHSGGVTGNATMLPRYNAT